MPLTKAVFFYRYPSIIYFSIEKLFQRIAQEINNSNVQKFFVEEIILPHESKPKNIFSNIAFTRRNQSSINHITGDVHYAILGCNKKNLNVLTVHDCVPLHRSFDSKLRFFLMKKLWFDWPVKKADIVTVISENTKKDLIRFTKCDPEKIRVIYNFVDPSFHYSTYTFNQKCPRILFVGTTENKNLERLAEALQEIPSTLDIIGPLNNAQKKKLEDFQIKYEQSENLSSEALQNKYHSCDMVAFPSTFEGFGLPIVEAQAVGRPVLTSNISPMCDVAADAACLIDPFDASSIREGIIRLIHNASYREALIAKGTENIKRFSVETISEQYVSLYNEFLQKKNNHKN